MNSIDRGLLSSAGQKATSRTCALRRRSRDKSTNHTTLEGARTSQRVVPSAIPRERGHSRGSLNGIVSAGSDSEAPEADPASSRYRLTLRPDELPRAEVARRARPFVPVDTFDPADLVEALGFDCLRDVTFTDPVRFLRSDET